MMIEMDDESPAPLPLEEAATGIHSNLATPELKSAVRIVIADGHEMLREALSRLLDMEPGLKVIGKACDGAEAVELTQKLKPDILLMELHMPNHPGLEALKNLGSAPVPNETRIIVVTAAVSKREIAKVLQLGGRGIVLKDSVMEVLLKAIQTVMAGGYWVNKESLINLEQYLRDLEQILGSESRQQTYGLTTREQEIVSAVVQGYSNKDIADHFKISEETVKDHIRNIFDKVGVSTRLELALFAVNHLPLLDID